MPEPTSPILQAMYRGDRDEARKLAQDRVLDVLEAAALGEVNHLTALLDADPTVITWRSEDGFTPLHYAAFLGGAAAVEVLVERGADVAAVTENAMRVEPLHSATAARDIDAVACLLAAGAPVDAQQTGGWTALQQAAQNGHETLVMMLLANGADPAVANNAGKRAFELAAEAGHTDLAERLRV
jgi:uncharacterized protein